MSDDQIEPGLKGHQGRCEAPELKVLIGQLAAQIENADQKNSAVLDQIQSQLEQLQAQSQSARRSLPATVAPAFDRLEDVIADLARKVDTASDGPALDMGPSPHAASRLNDLPQSDGEGQIPPALRSAISEHLSAYAQHSADVDPFGFYDDGLQGNPDAPWDEDTAEALTRIYETDLKTPAGASPAPGQATGAEASGHDPEPGQPTASGPNLSGPEPTEPQISQAWLEIRFTEIAQQVSQTLGANEAEVSFDHIARRLSDLETRFDSALQDVATRADFEALNAIEATLADLSTQFEQSRDDLSRVSAIEQEVMALAERLSDEHLTALAQPQASAASPDIDVEAIADQIATRLADQLPEPAPAPALSADADHQLARAEDLSELKSLVSSLLSTQQDGGEETNATLDTLQHAMTVLLDRMDSIEHAQLTLADGLKATPGAPAPTSNAPAAGPDREPRQESQAIRASQSNQTSQSNEAGQAGQPAETPARPRPQPSPQPSPERTTGQSSQQTASRSMEREEDDDDDVPTRREDFIAAARRAAQKATERASETAAGSSPAALRLSASRADSLQGYRTQRGTAGFATNATDDLDDEGLAAVGLDPANAGANSKTRLWLAGMALAVLALGAGAGGYILTQDRGGDTLARTLITPETRAREASVTQDSNASAQPSTRARDGETSSDPGSSDGRTTSDERTAVAEADPNAFPLGISLQHSDKEPTPRQVRAFEARKKKAELSTQLGATLPAASAVPASLMPDGGNGADTNSARSLVGSSDKGNVSQSIMPPAEIGPSSLRMAAANGKASAEFEVGARFAEGRGIEQDFNQASYWYGRASKQGFALAQYRLATLYERGLGVNKDKNLAKYWYLRAANQGTVKAMHNLAVLSAGQGNAKPDYTASAAWFTRAAERGLADSQFNLAILYLNGLGVQKDLSEAYKWFALAARAGDKEAASQRTAVAGQLAKTDRTALDREIESWRPDSFDKLANDASAAAQQWQASAS